MTSKYLSEIGQFTFFSATKNHKKDNKMKAFSMLDSAAVVVLFFSIVETLLIFIGNIFTIYVFWRHRTRLKRTSFLLINLAVADLLVELVETIVIGTSKIPLQFTLFTATKNRNKRQQSKGFFDVRHCCRCSSLFFDC